MEEKIATIENNIIQLELKLIEMYKKESLLKGIVEDVDTDADPTAANTEKPLSLDKIAEYGQLRSLIDRIYALVGGNKSHAPTVEKLAIMEQKLELFVEIREYILDNDDTEKKRVLRLSEKTIEKARKEARIE